MRKFVLIFLSILTILIITLIGMEFYISTIYVKTPNGSERSKFETKYCIIEPINIKSRFIYFKGVSAGDNNSSQYIDLLVTSDANGGDVKTIKDFGKQSNDPYNWVFRRTDPSPKGSYYIKENNGSQKAKEVADINDNVLFPISGSIDPVQWSYDEKYLAGIGIDWRGNSDSRYLLVYDINLKKEVLRYELNPVGNNNIAWAEKDDVLFVPDVLEIKVFKNFNDNTASMQSNPTPKECYALTQQGNNIYCAENVETNSPYTPRNPENKEYSVIIVKYDLINGNLSNPQNITPEGILGNGIVSLNFLDDSHILFVPHIGYYNTIIDIDTNKIAELNDFFTRMWIDHSKEAKMFTEPANQTNIKMPIRYLGD